MMHFFDRITLRGMWLLTVGLLPMLLFTSCLSSQEIVHGLEEWEANEILVVLNQKNITAEKVKEEARVVTYAVSVSSSEALDAMSILVANKLPKKRSQGLQEVYPSGGGGLIPTRSEEKARFLMAVQGELERKLKSLPGIVMAHVSIVDPEKSLVRDLNKEPSPPTASVAIVFNPIDEKDTPVVSAEEIQRMVAGSVEGLKIHDVNVVMKKNTLTRIMDFDSFSQSSVGSQSSSVLGIQVKDGASATRFKILIGLFGGLAMLGFITAAATLWRGRANAIQHAGNGTQTSLSKIQNL